MLWRLLFILALFFTARISYANEECTVEWTGGKARLDEVVSSSEALNKALLFLEEFQVSHRITKVFRQKAQRKEIIINTLGLSLPDISVVKKPAALFDFVRKIPTIYLNQGEFGVFAVLLFHEIIHANDEKYAEVYLPWKEEQDRLAKLYNSLVPYSDEWNSWQAKTEKQKRIRDRMVFQAERLGYDGQIELLTEMDNRFACAGSYFRSRSNQKKLIVDPVSDDDLVSIYKLNIQFIR